MYARVSPVAGSLTRSTDTHPRFRILLASQYLIFQIYNVCVVVVVVVVVGDRIMCLLIMYISVYINTFNLGSQYLLLIR